jgi:hypothetical protein
MSGKGQPGSVGAGAQVEDIDPGTSALIRMPPPAAPKVASHAQTLSSRTGNADAPMSGGIPYVVGQPSIVRIPVPGTNGLCIQLSPRGWTPRSGSTSTLFFQDATGNRQLRLDYGYNVKTRTIDYHWNQKGTFDVFGIADHSPAGQVGEVAYNAAKYFRYAGRVLVVVGVAIDVVSIVQASKPLRRASQVVVGWAAAWAGCQVVGGGGAALGTLASPIGTAIGGIGGCIIGGIGGYYGGSIVGGEVYDWAENTFFTPLPEVPRP